MKAMLAAPVRDPGSAALGCVLLYRSSVPQSLLGWPTFIVKAAPTSSHFFFFSSLSLRETSYPSVSLTWVSLRAALVWCVPPTPPAFPRAQLDSSFNRLHSRDDRRQCVCSETDKSVPPEKQQLYRGGKKNWV